MNNDFKNIAISEDINADTIQEKIFEIAHTIEDPDNVFKFYVELNKYLDSIQQPLIKHAKKISFMESVLGVKEYDKVNEPKVKSVELILDALISEGITYEIKNKSLILDNGSNVIEYKSKDRFNKLVINGVLKYIEKIYG